jgi:hypothetical protein
MQVIRHSPNMQQCHLVHVPKPHQDKAPNQESLSAEYEELGQIVNYGS